MSNETLSSIEERLREASKRAQTEATCVWVNVPGVLAAQVAPRESVRLMKPEYRGSFRFEHQTPAPETRRLSSTVRRKVERQLSGGRPAVLVVYDQLMTDEGEQSLAEYGMEALVTTYPNLRAVVFVHPFLWRDPTGPELETRDGRTIGRHSLPDREGESFILWPSATDSRSADTVLRAVTDFPANIARLYSHAELEMNGGAEV